MTLHLLLDALLLSLQTCILYGSHCGGRKQVNGIEGKDAILRVEFNETMGNITWLAAGNHFATTGPDGFIKVRDKRYKEKVFATKDGSLNITRLARDDQEAYAASTLRHTTSRTKLCAQYYDLRVYRELMAADLQIGYTYTYNGTCNLAVTCKVEEPDVTITWRRPTKMDVPVTANVLYVYDPDPNITITCAAQNPISVAHKSITPWDYCKQGSDGLNKDWLVSPRSSTGRISGPDYALMNIIRLALAVCVFVALCWFAARCGKRSCDRATDQCLTEVPRTPDRDLDKSDGAHPTTIYVLAQ